MAHSFDVAQITSEMVAKMKPGSVIVDIAGGNCELTRPGESFKTDNGRYPYAISLYTCMKATLNRKKRFCL